MFSFLAPFALALPALAGGDHAALHPATANYYFEVPDVPTAIAAYREAPLVRLFQDEEIGALVRKFAGEDASLGSLMREVVEEGLGEAYPRVAELAALIARVRSASLSVSGLGEGEFDFASLEQDPEGLLEQVGLLAVLEFPDGASARDLIESVGGWSDTPPQPTGAVVRLMGEESEVLEWPLTSGEGGPAVWIVPFDRYLAVGLGATTPAQLEQRGRGEGTALIAAESFRVGLDHFDAPEGAVLLESFTNFETEPFYVEFLRENLGKGAGAVEWLISDLLPTGRILARTRIRLVEGRFVSEGYAQPLDDPGTLARVFQTKPVSPAALTRVHPESVGVWATTFDASALSQNLVRVVARLTDSTPEEFRARMREAHGLDVDSIFGALGDDVTFYLMPISGPTLPKVYAAVEITDPAEVERGLTALGELLTEKTGGLVVAESKPYRKVPIVEFRPDLDKILARFEEREEDAPVPLKITPTFFVPQLAFAVLPDRVLLALSPIHVKREVRRLVKGQDLPHPAVTAEGLYPPEATYTGYLDWGSIFEGIYGAVTAFLPLMASSLDMPIDVSDLPDGSLFRRYFRPSISWSVNDGGVRYVYEESSFGPEVQLFLTAALAGSLVLGTRVEPREPTESLEVVPVPAEPAIPPGAGGGTREGGDAKESPANEPPGGGAASGGGATSGGGESGGGGGIR